VRNKAIYLAFGVNLQGLKEVLGIWASDNEGSKFWMQVITELKTRGVQDKINRLRRWSERIPRSHRSDLSANSDSALYCSPGSPLALLRLAQRQKRDCSGLEIDLSGSDFGRG
jgi:hypothetical protein